MDESPLAQLLAHADQVEAAHLQVVKASQQLAAAAEADRPGRPPASTHDGHTGQP